MESCKALFTDGMTFFTPAWFAMLVNVIMIDIVMSADNAILIGLATQRLAAKDKKKAIIFGIAGAERFYESFSQSLLFSFSRSNDLYFLVGFCLPMLYSNSTKNFVWVAKNIMENQRHLQRLAQHFGRLS